MKRFGLIAAVNRSGVIGKVSGGLPWSFHADMQHFKEVTSCYQTTDLNRSLIYPHPKRTGVYDDKSQPWKAVIMGRKTFASMEYKPLPHRHNIVISKEMLTGPVMDENVSYVSGDNAIVGACGVADQFNEVWVMGGASIYKQFLEADLIERMLITEVPSELPINGVFFPNWAPYLFRRTMYTIDTNGSAAFHLHNTEIKNGHIVHDFRRLESEEE